MKKKMLIIFFVLIGIKGIAQVKANLIWEELNKEIGDSNFLQLENQVLGKDSFLVVYQDGEIDEIIRNDSTDFQVVFLEGIFALDFVRNNPVLKGRFYKIETLVIDLEEGQKINDVSLDLKLFPKLSYVVIKSFEQSPEVTFDQSNFNENSRIRSTVKIVTKLKPVNN